MSYKDEPTGEAAGVKTPVIGDLQRFTVDVPQSFIDLTTKKLELTRIPENVVTFPPGKEWDDGTPNDELRKLVDYWLTGKFNWAEQQAKLNSEFGEQYRLPVEVPGGFGVIKVHFAVRRSTRKGAVPLLLCHGWPGSFYEFKKVIGLLAEPEDVNAPAFHVVTPSIPGYAFSTAPKIPGFGFKQIAYVYQSIMQTLSYKHYAVHGGDWGHMILRYLCLQYPESVRAAHTTMPLVTPPTLFTSPLKFISTVLGFLTGGAIGLSKTHIDELKTLQEYRKLNDGYFKQQSTYPASLAAGMGDSPVGLLSWLRDKFNAWTDNYPWTEEEVWMWVMLYWIPGPLGGFRLYKEHVQACGDLGPAKLPHMSQWSPVKLGISKFQVEILKMPADWMENIHPVTFVRNHSSGGHFAAWEKPVEIAQDLRDFLGPIIKEDKFFSNASTE
ncbi:Alpha/Beta hydrolase protein [Peziza echinospora]|nr:Alpha/Beta hydrolase protein [Peziza echinospora]